MRWNACRGGFLQSPLGGRRTSDVNREEEGDLCHCEHALEVAGHIGLQPVAVCNDHQLLQSWHNEHVNIPWGPAARRAQWHEKFAKFHLSVVYVPGKDKTVGDGLSRQAYPASKAWMDISSRGDAEETEEAKRIIELEKAIEEGNTKCFVVMASKAELSQGQDAVVWVLMEETLE